MVYYCQNDKQKGLDVMSHLADVFLNTVTYNGVVKGAILTGQQDRRDGLRNRKCPVNHKPGGRWVKDQEAQGIGGQNVA